MKVLKTDMPLSEADIKAKYIDPKIHECGWLEESLIREYPISQDRFFVEGEEFKKLNTKKFADYVLKYKEVNIALIEAKSEDEDPEKHLGQAQDYAKRLEIPFVYVSNGTKTVLHDRRTLKTNRVDEYLKPEELYKGYIEWKGLGKKKIDALNYPLHISGTKKPRSYQEAATNAIVENIVKGKTKTLLTMATGTGKTYVAFQAIWKLVKSKHFSRVLFLADRIILRDDAHERDFEPFGEARCKIEGGNFNKNRDIYFSTYQTLFTNDLYKKIPGNFFDLVVIDECHRSRYGDWGVILDHFDTACHLGMTATPKREDNVDVYEYFGKPVFEYSMGEAIEDGYLVPYKVFKVDTNIDKTGVNVSEAEEVLYDDEIEPEKIKDFYTPGEFERVITLPDRTDELCKKTIDILDKTNSNAKTIVFCTDMTHAQQVKDKFIELKKNEEFASRIVAEDKDDLTKFRDKEMPMPVIATTVDLLSTGVDIPHLQNIVFMRPVSSQVLFKQIIGRGSRLFEGKGFFRIIDFTNATRLIDEWDLPKSPEESKKSEEPVSPYDKLLFGVVIDKKSEKPVAQALAKVSVGRWDKSGATQKDGSFKVFGVPSNNAVSLSISKDSYKLFKKRVAPQESEEDEPYVFSLTPEGRKSKKITVKGIEVSIEEEVEIEFEGRKLSFAEYKKYSSRDIKEKVHDLEELRNIWLDNEKRDQLLKDLEKKSISINLIKSIDKLEDSDSFDVIAKLAFNAPVLTREDRTKSFFRKNMKEISQYGDVIKNTVYDVLDRYKYSGEESLSPQVFMLPNMHSQKDTIQKEYPKGLNGFMHFLKEKVYSQITK